MTNALRRAFDEAALTAFARRNDRAVASTQTFVNVVHNRPAVPVLAEVPAWATDNRRITTEALEQYRAGVIVEGNVFLVADRRWMLTGISETIDAWHGHLARVRVESVDTGVAHEGELMVVGGVAEWTSGRMLAPPPPLGLERGAILYRGAGRWITGALIPMPLPDPAAEKRALELLRHMLTPEQRKQFDREEVFRHHGTRGTYVFRPGLIALHTAKDVRMLCVHPMTPGLPLADRTLALLLHLRDDEERFMRTANVTAVVGNEDALRHLQLGGLWRHTARY